MSNQKNLNLLAKGVVVWNRWKEDTHNVTPGHRWDFSYDADLSGANLSKGNLSKANLGLVDLSDANLTGSRLVGACLAGSELASANFTEADLTGVDLSGANICGANFSGADLTNADLSGADLSEACFQGANLSGADLSYTNLSDVRFQGANLSGANLSGVYYGTSFKRAKFCNLKDAGAIVGKAGYTNHQRAYKRTWFLRKKKDEHQQIVFYPSPSLISLAVTGVCVLLVMAGVWLLQRGAKDEISAIFAWVLILLCGLGVVILSFQWLRQLFCSGPVLIIDENGIQYFYPFLYNQAEQMGITRRNTILKWQEIGAIGLIKYGQTDSFVVYSLARRWRTGWFPSIYLPQNFLSISTKQLIILIQMQYQEQIETYHIKNVELMDE